MDRESCIYHEWRHMTATEGPIKVYHIVFSNSAITYLLVHAANNYTQTCPPSADFNVPIRPPKIVHDFYATILVGLGPPGNPPLGSDPPGRPPPPAGFATPPLSPKLAAA